MKIRGFVEKDKIVKRDHDGRVQGHHLQHGPLVGHRLGEEDFFNIFTILVPKAESVGPLGNLFRASKMSRSSAPHLMD